MLKVPKKVISSRFRVIIDENQGFSVACFYRFSFRQLKAYEPSDPLPLAYARIKWRNLGVIPKGTFTYQLTALEVGRCQPKCQVSVSIGR